MLEVSEALLINLLNGLSAGLLLFMLSAGLTLIFSMMGVLNFAHASFYMLGAFVACTLAQKIGFGAALLLAPLAVGLIGMGFERQILRRVHRFGHVSELLVTFGASYVMLELVQLIWGRSPQTFAPPEWLRGAAFTLVQAKGEGLHLVLGNAAQGVCAAASCSSFPATRAFIMLVALAMLLGLWLLLTRTRIGLVIQASLTHPDMVEALGHNVPRVSMGLFGGGCALAALAGVMGGVTFVTEPAMAMVVGSIVFVVVVVGGMGSLVGAFVASILIGLLQTLPLAMGETAALLAPILPYGLLVLVLLWRPQGLLGTRSD